GSWIDAGACASSLHAARHDRITARVLVSSGRRNMKWMPICIILLAVLVVPVSAEDSINYKSQPDQLVVFLNDIAYARDAITLPGEVDVKLVLPAQVFPDTLVVRENGE